MGPDQKLSSVATPTLDRLAAESIRFNDTRAAQDAAQQPHAPNRDESPKGSVDLPQPLVLGEVTQHGAVPCNEMLEKMAEVHGNRTHRPQG